MAGPTIQLAGGSGRRIGGDHPCLIVAEIGQNHQGDVNIARQMIDMAKVREHRHQPMSPATGTYSVA